MEIVTQSAEETEALGARLGAALTKGTVLSLFGDLAAGKTTFTKGLVNGATGLDTSEVSSPTFIYLNTYEGKTPVYHFDLYRLHDEDEFLSMGFDDYFFSDGICCIEWPERVSQILPESAVKLTLEHCGENRRKITIHNWEGTL